MNGSVTVTVAAPAAALWDLVTDVTRIGEFSPETFEAQWITEPPGPAVGAMFRGHVRRNGRGPVYWTDCRVLRCEPPTLFEFGVHVRSRLVNTWTYLLHPVAGRTAVTESYTLTPTALTRLYWTIAGRWRSATNQRGMPQTLQRIKAVAESATPPSRRS